MVGLVNFYKQRRYQTMGWLGVLIKIVKIKKLELKVVKTRQRK